MDIINDCQKQYVARYHYVQFVTKRQFKFYFMHILHDIDRNRVEHHGIDGFFVGRKAYSWPGRDIHDSVQYAIKSFITYVRFDNTIAFVFKNSIKRSY